MPIFKRLFCVVFVALSTLFVAAQTQAPPVPEVPGVVETKSTTRKSNSQREDPSAVEGQEKKSTKDGDANAYSNRIQSKKRSSSIEDFLRVRRNAKRKPIAFQTSVTRYIHSGEDGRDVSVDLIGVVHIGEGDYYRQLNQIFDNYDAVLYELVAPEGDGNP